MQRLHYLIGTVLLLALIILIEHWIGWRALLQPWREVSPSAIATAIILVFFSYALRAMRLYDYFRPATSGLFQACFKLMLWHNVWNNFLPMRSGEVSFPILMQRYFQTPLAQSIPALLWFRLLDLHSLLALALAALASVWLPLLQTALLLCAWLSLPWLGFRFQQVLFNQLLAASQKKELTTASFWQDQLATIQAGLPQTPMAFWRSWLWTLLNWLVKLAVFAWVLRIFIDLPLSATLLGAVGGELTSVLPVHGLAGAGTYEAGIVAALLPFAISAEQALQGAVNLHMFFLCLSLLSGGIAWFLRSPPCPSTPIS